MARQHARQNGARGIDMAHHVHFPGAQPIAIGRAAIAVHSDARVGTKEIDLSIAPEDFIHQHLDVGFARDVGVDVPAANLGRHSARRLVLDVGHHHRFRAFRRKPPAQSAANSVGAAGDDHDLALNIHGVAPDSYNAFERRSMNRNSILIDLSESERTKFGKEDFEGQSVPQKVFSSIWAVESQVNNGGFSQYFLNSSAETAPFVAQALEAIGAPRTAEICGRAIACGFPAGLPPTPEAISAAAAEFSDETLDELETLDAEFFAYPYDLTDLLFAFVSKHPDEFGTLPQPD